MILCTFSAGCAAAYDFSGYRADPGGPPPEVDASEAPADGGPPPASAANIRPYGSYRGWSDGTYAPSCDAYLHPSSSGYVYEGSVGSGVYGVKPARAATPILVYCDMTAKGEGWTLVSSSSAAQRNNVTATTQTLDCVTPGAYCNVAGEPWDYEMLRHTWSGCPGAEARITRAAFQDDTGACLNQVDSLLITYDVPRFVGLKSWGDCTYGCLGQSWFAGQSLQAQSLSLITDAKLVTGPVESLVEIAATAKCPGKAYYCAVEGVYDAIWLR